MSLNIYQIIYLAIEFIAIGIELTEHGKPYKYNHNFTVYLFTFLFEMFLLVKGGFFE